VFALSGAAAGQDLCSQKREEVASSPTCLRWWFTCYLKKLHKMGAPDPRYASLPLKKRQEILVRATAGYVEQYCLNFSYVELEAATRLKLLSIE
jgi:hypothetical protein